jgi:hypothetical protein
MHILNPETVSIGKRSDILASFAPLLSRPQKHLIDELNMPDRLLFDTAVLQSFGLVDVYPKVKESLLHAYHTRQTANDTH